MRLCEARTQRLTSWARLRIAKCRGNSRWSCSFCSWMHVDCEMGRCWLWNEWIFLTWKLNCEVCFESTIKSLGSERNMWMHVECWVPEQWLKAGDNRSRTDIKCRRVAVVGEILDSSREVLSKASYESYDSDFKNHWLQWNCAKNEILIEFWRLTARWLGLFELQYIDLPSHHSWTQLSWVQH